MDPELKKALDELRAQIGRHVDVAARVDKIETDMAARATTADLKTARADLEKLQTLVADRDAALKTLQEQGRVQALQRDPIRDRIEAKRMLGMIVRAEIARNNRWDLPADFQGEIALVRSYREQVIARATLTPMSTTGSYVVPTVTDRSIMDAVEEVSQLLSLVDFQPGLPAGGTFNFTFLATRPSMLQKRASTDTAFTASDPVFSQLVLSPNETYVFFPIDNKLFLMSAVALGGYFEGLCRDAMIDKLAYWLLRADAGASYNSITGLLAQTTYTVSLPNGKTAFADVTADDIYAAEDSVLGRGRGPNGRWLLSHDILGIVKNIDRLGKMGLIDRVNGNLTIDNYPTVQDTNMPVRSESAKGVAFAAFGDLKSIIVGMVGGMQIASDSSVRFDKNQTCFRATTIVDIKQKPVNTLVTLKTAAA
jgi:HK97 family phage major capsid protein